MLWCSFAVAQQQSDHKPLFVGGQLDFEQDFLLEWMGLQNEDRNYTQGLNLSLYFDGRSNKWLFNPKKNNNGNQYAYSPTVFLAQLAAFTPDDLQQTEPIVGDRPYSTVFMLGMKNGEMDVTNSIFIQKGVFIGALGIDGPARHLQTKVHKGMNDGNTKPPYNPMGWHNQISNGGEPTVMYSFNRSTLITKKRLQAEMDMDVDRNPPSWNKVVVSYDWGYSLGYLTQASAGVNFKYGKLELSNWATGFFNSLEGIANFYGIMSPADADSRAYNYYRRKKRPELYFFASIAPSLTLYNGSLHGGFRESAYRLDYDETAFLTGQLRFGLAWTSRWHTLSIYQGLKAPEVWNEYTRMHHWGGVSLGFFCGRGGGG